MRRARRRTPRDPAAQRTVVQDGGGPPPAVEEEEIVQPGRRPPELWPWLLLLLLLVIGGLLAAYFLTRDNDKKSHKTTTATVATVPNVVGLKQNVAVQRLNARGLIPRITTKPSKSPAGVVFAAQPAAGTKVTSGSPVTIAVSGSQVTRVPNVVGVPTAVAVKRLRTNGLAAATVSVVSSKPSGTVLTQNPAAGASVSKGSTISIHVSKGQATIPNVVGQPLSSARAALRGAGLVAAVFDVPSAQPKGTVVAQHPAANTKVARGSKVRINVSTGSAGQTPTTGGTTTRGTTTTTPAAKTVRVPKVVGLQQSAAQRRLNAAGLGSRVVYIASPKPAGQVIGQSPAAGTQAKRGSKVRIDVALGSNPGPQANVPDVVGQDQQTATSTLRNAGFTVQVITVPATDPSQNGVVVDEQPAAGSKAPKGSQVTIYVGSSSG